MARGTLETCVSERARTKLTYRVFTRLRDLVEVAEREDWFGHIFVKSLYQVILLEERRDDLKNIARRKVTVNNIIN